MITPQYLQLMARYNRWQNRSIYDAADTLSNEQRNSDQGAFFSSIHGTLNHSLWADQLWLNRFAGTPAPTSPDIPGSVAQYSDWAKMKTRRAAFDEDIIKWASELDPAWLVGDLSWYSGAMKRDVTKPKALLAAHLFNHQTHHRGQVHAMLTRLGAKPTDTDIPFLPDAL